MSFTVYYSAWDVANSQPKDNDAGNHSVTVRVDGSDITGLSPSFLGSGQYEVSLTDQQIPEGSRFAVRGTSSTNNVYIFGELGLRPKTNYSTHTATDVWAISTRTLTGNDNLNDPDANSIASAVWNYVVEGSRSAVQSIRLILSVLAGKTEGSSTTNVKFYATDDDSQARIEATVDEDNNRTSITYDDSD